MVKTAAEFKALKRQLLWVHVCKCLKCQPTLYHDKVIKEIISEFIKKGQGQVLKFHNEQSGGRGLLDPIIPNGFDFCDVGRLLFAAYNEWSVE